ncbi:hypothetical protein MRX96_018265 [Rhipicephalus microplus]
MKEYISRRSGNSSSDTQRNVCELSHGTAAESLAKALTAGASLLRTLIAVARRNRLSSFVTRPQLPEKNAAMDHGASVALI